MCVTAEGNETLTVTSSLEDVQALYRLCLLCPTVSLSVCLLQTLYPPCLHIHLSELFT